MLASAALDSLRALAVSDLEEGVSGKQVLIALHAEQSTDSRQMHGIMRFLTTPQTLNRQVSWDDYGRVMV